jgi:Glycosyl hydrolase catalytic core
MRASGIFKPAVSILLAAAAFFPLAGVAQTLTLTNGIQTCNALTNITVTMSGQCELRVNATNNPIPGCLINLNSSDAWFFFPNIQPSVVASSYLGQIRVNGASAVADSNVRVVQYAMGAVVIPHASALQPLQVFNGPHFIGTSMPLSQFVSYSGTGLGAMDQGISSFKLKRGYMATLAQNVNGSGFSQCYVAQDAELEVGILPAELDHKIRFVRVYPWRWASKKGIAGNIPSNLNVRWYYDWNIDQNSSRDLEYVPIRQNRYWPGLGQNWQTRGANHLLGYNEPDHADQANLTVDDAIYSWPDLLATGLRVGAPAVSDGGLSWLYSFIDQADAAGLRVDFVPVHYYRCYGNPADANGAANQLYTFLKGIYDRVKRPL